MLKTLWAHPPPKHPPVVGGRSCRGLSVDVAVDTPGAWMRQVCVCVCVGGGGGGGGGPYGVGIEWSCVYLSVGVKSYVTMGVDSGYGALGRF